MDLRAQGRVERSFFYAHTASLLLLHAKTWRRSLRYDVDLVRVWVAVEANAGNAANYFAVDRLLAAETFSEIVRDKTSD